MEAAVLPEFRKKELHDLDKLQLQSVPIGGGQYGKVYAGLLNDLQVAVKTTKGK